MTRVRLILILAAVALGPRPALPTDSPAGQVAWLKYDEALATAHRRGLPLLIFFRQDNCRPCEVLSKQGFDRPDIAGYVNQRLAPARVDLDREPELKKKFRVAGAPTVWFLAPDGKEIDFFTGYVPADRLLLILRYVGDGAYRTMTFEEFERREAKTAKDQEGK